MEYFKSVYRKLFSIQSLNLSKFRLYLDRVFGIGKDFKPHYRIYDYFKHRLNRKNKFIYIKLYRKYNFKSFR